MSNQLNIYLAGPITGRSGGEVLDRYAEKIALLTDFGYTVYCPMLGKGHLRTEPDLGAEEKSYPPHPITSNHAIYTRDQWMIRQSDVILADLSNSGSRVSIGTMMELAWGSLLGKHIVTVLPEGNIHSHAFVFEATNLRFHDLDAALDYLKELSIGRRSVL